MNPIAQYAAEREQELLDLLRQLCLIPAPSYHEQGRALFCKEWLEQNGAKGVVIDEACNVLLPINCEGSDRITVYAAHTDTVFPDTEPMPYTDDGEWIHSPGVGDNTARVAMLLLTAKYAIASGFCPKDGVLFVWNACEEGLGNLNGTRRLFHDYEGRIARFLTADGSFSWVCRTCVGSHRYRVTVRTPGGHSFGAFGNANAIAKCAEMITAIYRLPIPPYGKATYNVGTIEGGTSVNTIAQEATFLCEYRSDDVRSLACLQQGFERIFAETESEDVSVTVEKVGDRPCAAEGASERSAELAAVCREAMNTISDLPPDEHPASTDCNIPLSLGIPAVCFGAGISRGAHTREERTKKDQLVRGLELMLTILLKTEEHFGGKIK